VALELQNMKSIDSLLDKILLIGITVLDNNDELITQIQVYGPVIKSNADGIVICRNQTQKEFTIPPDFDNVSEAQPGEYKLRSTGEIIIDPDYLSSWTVRCSSKDQVKQYSEVGFGGYQKQ
jgi:hypothetical protein